MGRKGAAGAVHYSSDPCWPIDTAFYTEGNDQVFLPYFRYLLQSLHLVALDRSTAVPSLSKPTTNLASIGMTKLKALPIPIPPATEQERIVAELERLLSVVDEVDEVVSFNLQRAARLRQSILERAFTGRLTSNNGASQQAVDDGIKEDDTTHIQGGQS